MYTFNISTLTIQKKIFYLFYSECVCAGENHHRVVHGVFILFPKRAHCFHGAYLRTNIKHTIQQLLFIFSHQRLFYNICQIMSHTPGIGIGGTPFFILARPRPPLPVTPEPLGRLLPGKLEPRPWWYDRYSKIVNLKLNVLKSCDQSVQS